ncbi:DUF397 domain-containing protein [Streptomyces sp. MUM 178J]|uniref:DUF397 domain-containing protein n=1 Tax=Streptomyces sp. MUM 178J TaxID=2791991 RepID=UPI0027E2267A|nr:DUF397 domain-containing protein [Streptomyces sp. MUM 178J]WRQ82255.1 DUF397 domain-containing protein [Streptomyces sp. MUM 178J]
MGSTLRWFESGCSSPGGGESVEAAACPHTVHVRDSKTPDGPTFAVTPAARSTFLRWAD